MTTRCKRTYLYHWADVAYGEHLEIPPLPADQEPGYPGWKIIQELAIDGGVKVIMRLEVYRGKTAEPTG